jgi:AcrR family transcriptional regulator
MTHTKSTGADLRVKRTQKLLMAALLELAVQKGFSGVSVSDITKHAGINRATFYRHYQDKFDLLNQYAQTVYELLDAPLESRLRTSSEGNAEQMAAGLVRIFEHIRANARFYRVMLGKNGDPVFAEKIRQYVQKRIRRSLPAELQKDERWVELYLSSSSSASIGAVMWWLEHEMPYSAEEMARISYQLSAAILSALVPAPASEASGSLPQSLPHY